MRRQQATYANAKQSGGGDRVWVPGEFRELSRRAIKQQDLEHQIKACRKSLEAAQRSRRENLVKSLQVKLDGLIQQSQGGSKPDPCDDEVQKIDKRAGKRRDEPPTGGKLKSLKSAKSTPREKDEKPSRKTAKLVRRAEGRSEKKRKVSTSARAGADERPKKGAKARSQRQTAVDILMRAAAARNAEDVEESDEEDDFNLDEEVAAAMAELEEEEEEHEEEDGEDGDEETNSDAQPAGDNSDSRAPLNDDSQSGDFFDFDTVAEVAKTAASSSLDTSMSEVKRRQKKRKSVTAPVKAAMSPERVEGHEPPVSARRAKKIARSERRARLKQQKLEWHPSWRAARAPKVSGALVRGVGGKLRTFGSNE
eukprot:gnl/TRDRNA2_/TRDRNA2_90447_c0_seq1.p1 gnl/TRDRNA2_/TRDRNA2_90447_c0~~gnl/TRDRNA2_/TRDRNA2_90447_c0_seq1.p1  ORF type:complete len:366 (+),score=100.74 gnl/TRDRNA2_/TRDRNA2_90447_c0_seq1:121-1218(+)